MREFEVDSDRVVKLDGRVDSDERVDVDALLKSAGRSLNWFIVSSSSLELGSEVYGEWKFSSGMMKLLLELLLVPSG